MPQDASRTTDHVAQTVTAAPNAAYTHPSQQREPGYALKRLLDVAGAMLGLGLLWPVMACVALVVRLTSKGPVLFRQQRLGLYAQPFTFYKFRTMTCDADDRLHREYVSQFIQGQAANSPSERRKSGTNGQTVEGLSGPTVYKLKQDPRITPIGRWLRKSSLDELPQLFNVLRGDMSLVGPRPPIAYEVAQYEPWHMQRLMEAKPGITGLWQVEGRSRVPFDDMVRMDLHYARTCSLWGDLKLLARTVAVVLRGAGGA